MQMLGPSMPCWPRMYELMIFFINAIRSILLTSIHVLAPDASR